jgi:hypothetical protein
MDSEGLGDFTDQFPLIQQPLSELRLLRIELPRTPKPHPLSMAAKK